MGSLWVIEGGLLPRIIPDLAISRTHECSIGQKYFKKGVDLLSYCIIMRM
jgi:hypothetical protein